MHDYNSELHAEVIGIIKVAGKAMIRQKSYLTLLALLPSIASKLSAPSNVV